MFVEWGSFMDLKTHMLIKSDSLWILFIYRNFIGCKLFNPVLNEFPADTFSTEIRSNKEHFNLSVFYAHKSDRRTIFIFRNYQIGYLL